MRSAFRPERGASRTHGRNSSCSSFVGIRQTSFLPKIEYRFRADEVVAPVPHGARDNLQQTAEHGPDATQPNQDPPHGGRLLVPASLVLENDGLQELLGRQVQPLGRGLALQRREPELPAAVATHDEVDAPVADAAHTIEVDDGRRGGQRFRRRGGGKAHGSSRCERSSTGGWSPAFRPKPGLQRALPFRNGTARGGEVLPKRLSRSGRLAPRNVRLTATECHETPASRRFREALEKNARGAAQIGIRPALSLKHRRSQN